jgi:hypothetical protein
MDFDPYETWLGIPADLRPPTCYDLLGLAYHEPDLAVIEIAALRRMGKVRLQADGILSEHISEVLAELAKARSILLDSDLRAAYDTELKLRRQERTDIATAPNNGASDVIVLDEPNLPGDAPDGLGSLVITDEPGDQALRKSAIAGPRPPLWKKALLYSAMLLSHLLLLGFFLLYVSISSNSNWKWPWSLKKDTDALQLEREPQGSRTFGRDAQDREDPVTIILPRRADSGVPEPLWRERATKSGVAKPKKKAHSSGKTEPAPAQQKPGNGQ